MVLIKLDQMEVDCHLQTWFLGSWWSYLFFLRSSCIVFVVVSGYVLTYPMSYCSLYPDIQISPRERTISQLHIFPDIIIYNNIYIYNHIYINIDYYCCDTYCWCCYYDVLHLQKNGTLSRMCPLSCCVGWHSSTFFRVTISIFDWWGIFRAVIYII